MRVLKIARRKVDVERVAFSPDNLLLLVCAPEMDVGPWNVLTGERAFLDASPEFMPGMAAMFHPSGRWLVGTSLRKGLATYDLEAKTTTRIPNDEDAQLIWAQFTPNGETLISCCDYPGTKHPVMGDMGERRLVCQPWNPDGSAKQTWNTGVYPDHPERRG